MRSTIKMRSQTKRRLLTLSLVTAGLACALIPWADWHGAEAQSLKQMPLRYLVETRETATFYVGKEGKINIVLLDQNGDRLKAPQNLRTTVTVTSLESLDKAKRALAARPPTQQAAQSRPASQNPRLVLSRGQKAAQIAITYDRGEADKMVQVVSYQPGRLQVFVESDHVAAGQTVIVVLDARRDAPSSLRQSTPAPPAEGLMPILWQNAEAAQLRLEFSPAKPFVQTEKGEQLAYFKVELKSAADDRYVGAPEALKVILKVEDGYARFEPDIIAIPKGEVITPEPTALRTRPGGRISVSAWAKSTASFSFKPDRRDYDFSPGVHSTTLSIQRQRESAFANGLDEIELRVEALQDGRVITPEEEGMEERIIAFRLIGDAHGVRFENDSGEVHMARGQQSGTIKLFSSRPASGLKVVAEASNGLRQKITSGDMDIPVRFSFPWFQLFCATLGGGLLPCLRRQNRTKLAQGVVLGAVFFGLALFGALASNPQTVGAISLILTKLPTENFFAAFILGFLGSLLLSFSFKGQPRTGSKRKAATA